MTVQLPFDQARPLQVPPLLRTLQAQGTIHKIRTRVGDDAWLVIGYEDVRRLLDDDRLGRSHPDPDNAYYGVGPLTSVAIWEERGDTRRFSSSADAVRHSGLDVSPALSRSMTPAGSSGSSTGWASRM